MKDTTGKSLVALPAILLLLSAQGCPSPLVVQNLDYLTAAEQQAVLRCTQAVHTLVTAACVTQAGSDQMSLPNARTAGVCPQVTLEADSGGLLSATLDFGTGCEPVFMPGVTIAGSLIGTLMPTSQSLSLMFNSFTVDSDVLHGTINVVFQLTGHTLSMEGNWYLDLWVSEASTQTEGEGSVAYNGDTYATVVNSFTGSVTRDSDTWSLTMNNIQVSYAAYQSFIPYGGQMTITGLTIRPLTIRFDTDSPSTGQVDVSFNGGTTWATVDMATLFASL